MSREYTFPTCLGFYFYQGRHSTELCLLNSHFLQGNHLPQQLVEIPICRHPDYTQKPTSVPLGLNPSFQIKHWSDPSLKDPHLLQAWTFPDEAEPGLFTHSPACEDEDLQLGESTVLHDFPFHRAKSCPQVVFCAHTNQRKTLMPVTPTETLWFQWTFPSKWTQQREGISKYNIKTNAEECCHFFLLQVFIALFLSFSSNDQRFCGREIKAKPCIWKSEASGLFLPCYWEKQEGEWAETKKEK